MTSLYHEAQSMQSCQWLEVWLAIGDILRLVHLRLLNASHHLQFRYSKALKPRLSIRPQPHTKPFRHNPYRSGLVQLDSIQVRGKCNMSIVGVRHLLPSAKYIKCLTRLFFLIRFASSVKVFENKQFSRISSTSLYIKSCLPIQ